MKCVVIGTFIFLSACLFWGECIAFQLEPASSLSQYPIEFLHLKSLESGVTIDGELESIWQEAATFPAFVQTRAQDSGAEARFKTQAFGFVSHEKLYLAFICDEPEISKLNTSSTYWDDPAMLLDDRVEIFIDPDHDHRSYYHLAVNTEGIQFDQEVFQRYTKTRTDERNTDWNCYWKARTKIEDQRWIAEIEIDLKSINTNAQTDVSTWGFNIGRARRPIVAMERGNKAKIPLSETEYSAWMFTQDAIWETVSNFFEPTEFGDVLFNALDFEIDNISFRNASFVYGGKNVPPTKVGWNPIDITFNRPLLTQDHIEIRLTTTSENGKSWQRTQQVDTKSNISFNSQYFIHHAAGESTLTIELLSSKTKDVHYQTTYVLTTPPFIKYDLSEVYLQPLEKIDQIPFTLNVDDATVAQSTLQLNLLTQDHQPMAEQYFEALDKTHASLSFDVQNAKFSNHHNYQIEGVLLDKQSQDTISYFVQNFTLNKATDQQKFEAIRGNYHYGGLEGDAVQVHFSDGQRFVFWEKASYVPWWEADQVAVSFGYTESAGASTQGCAEALQDRECRYSQVEIIENSDARIVIHWRYALADAHYKIHNNEWVDEYYYFYPDGVGVRNVNLWVNEEPKHTYEFFEVMIVSPPAVEDTDVFEDAVAQLSPLNGNQAISTSEMRGKGSKFYENFIHRSGDLLVDVNLRDRMHPFAVITFRDSINAGIGEKLPSLGYSVDYANTNNRGHWPASEYAVDGYNLVGNHRPTHGNMGSVFQGVNPHTNPNQFSVLIGMAEENTGVSMAHAKSWLKPAKVLSSASFLKYDVDQRAYCFSAANTESLEFILDPKEESIMNPVLIITDVADKQLQSLKIDGQEVDKALYQSALTKNEDIILFLNQKMAHKQSIQITFNSWDH